MAIAVGSRLWLVLTGYQWLVYSVHVARIAYPFDPDDLQAKNPPFVQDLLELKHGGYIDTISEISKMVAALKEQGNECGFLKKLKGTPISELKSHSRGGQKGGARVYLFEGLRSRDNIQVFLPCRAEWKPDNAPNQEMLEDTAYILAAIQDEQAVFPDRVKKRPPLVRKEGEGS